MYEYAIQPRRRSRKPSDQSVRRKPISHRRLEKATIVTPLEARMRASVDGATDNTFLNVHVDSLDQVIMAVRGSCVTKPRQILGRYLEMPP